MGQLAHVNTTIPAGHLIIRHQPGQLPATTTMSSGVNGQPFTNSGNTTSSHNTNNYYRRQPVAIPTTIRQTNPSILATVNIITNSQSPIPSQ
jgi:hypothetical protein